MNWLKQIDAIALDTDSDFDWHNANTPEEWQLALNKITE
jgi:hypothetical protein